MSDKPILFQAAMVRAQREDRKTQTRRLPTRLLRFGKITEFGASDTPGYDWHFRDKAKRWHDLKHDELLKVLPWQKGDRLWVRETWAPLDRLTHNDPGTTALIERGFYKADNSTIDGSISRWSPAIHMPRWASRLTLTVTDVRVQRLQEISEADCIAEGVTKSPHGDWYSAAPETRDPALAGCTPRGAYYGLWTRINGEGNWDANPWIVALTFTVEKRNIDAIEKAAA